MANSEQGGYHRLPAHPFAIRCSQFALPCNPCPHRSSSLRLLGGLRGGATSIYMGKRDMDLGLNGRRVLVTGGSQGIGLAVARGFLAEGASVTIVARDEGRLARAAAGLLQLPGASVHTRSADLAQAGAAQALADACPDTDILVNN